MLWNAKKHCTKVTENLPWIHPLCVFIAEVFFTPWHIINLRPVWPDLHIKKHYGQWSMVKNTLSGCKSLTCKSLSKTIAPLFHCGFMRLIFLGVTFHWLYLKITIATVNSDLSKYVELYVTSGVWPLIKVRRATYNYIQPLTLAQPNMFLSSI